MGQAMSDRHESTLPDTIIWAEEPEIASALVNLGCQKTRANQVAKQAIMQAEGFDARLRWAVSHATQAA
jgi:hypothetical protein